MQANIASGLIVWEFADGAAVECTTAVLEDLRRLAVQGFVAFGHGGLEVGGVLYGVREGDRLSIQAAAELPCEHALGPGFTLSDTDRQALGQLLLAPAGLECVGWYRSHTRSGLDLDAGDRDLFEQFFADRTSVGLVLKPTHWGQSAAAFYARRTNGEVLTSPQRDFTIDPLKSGQGEKEEPVASEAPELAAKRPSPFPAAWADTMVWPDAAAWGAAASPPRARAWRRAGAVVLAAAAILTIYYFGWLHHARKLALQVYATSPGQVRIEWNHNSLPVAKAEYGRLEIHDGSAERTFPLDRSQLQFSSIDYVQKSSRITVSLRIKPRRGAAVEESVEFVGPVEPAAAVADVIGAASSLPPPEPKVTESSLVLTDGASTAPSKSLAPPPAVSPAPTRKFYLPSHAPTASAGRIADLPEAPPVPAATNESPSLPAFASLTEPPPTPLKPPKPVSQPAPKTFTGPRSGRLIWTGELGRRTVIEIDGQHASIGSLSGSLSTGAAEYRVSPAEFTRDGVTVYTIDGAANGRTEAPSKENGWNSVHFVYDPVRAGELVVLERPSRINNFSRLVLRNDGRNCQVVLIDWTAQPDTRN